MSNPRADLSGPLADFLAVALPKLHADPRVVGVAAGGSFVEGPMDEYSDLDLVIAIEPDSVAAVMAERRQIAASLGTLLAAFTGEHVGEPRVLICLYGPPLLHVDLKFVSVADASDRVENPVILWEREGRLSASQQDRPARYPEPDLQWIEDRFWVWVHYAAARIGRGELFVAHDFLAFLRQQVLGPLLLSAAGARPDGVRRLESEAAPQAARLQLTLASYSRAACLDALEQAALLYRELRDGRADEIAELRQDAQQASMRYLQAIRASIAPTDRLPLD